MSKFIKNSSLKEEVFNSVKELLHDEGFEENDVLTEGVVQIVNLISDYKEEGQILFPEVVIINDFEIFGAISNKEIIINSTELNVSEFKNVIKLCAPLALGSWVIFIEVKDDKMIRWFMG